MYCEYFHSKHSHTVCEEYKGFYILERCISDTSEREKERSYTYAVHSEMWGLIRYLPRITHNLVNYLAPTR